MDTFQYLLDELADEAEKAAFDRQFGLSDKLAIEAAFGFGPVHEHIKEQAAFAADHIAASNVSWL